MHTTLKTKAIPFVKQKWFSGMWGPGVTYKDQLIRKSGKLIKSITPGFSDISQRNTRGFTYNTGIEIGEPPDYAGVHVGGVNTVNTWDETVIKPKNSQWLTIPFPGGPADRPRGALRASRFGKLTFIAPKGGRSPILFQKKGKDQLIPVFILKKSVTIRPRVFTEEIANAIGPMIWNDLINKTLAYLTELEIQRG